MKQGAVEKPVENVENYGFSTVIPEIYRLQSYA